MEQVVRAVGARGNVSGQATSFVVQLIKAVATQVSIVFYWYTTRQVLRSSVDTKSFMANIGNCSRAALTRVGAEECFRPERRKGVLR